MEIVLIVMVAAAAWTDLRTRKIPNWIPVSGALIGVVLGGLPSLAGAALGFGLFILIYMAGGMGAGDVKLFSAVGALVGPQALIIVFVLTGLIGGVAAVAVSIIRGRVRGQWLPYAPVIACGALLWLVSL
jgi:prepilin peptidase CpaA